jgi:hypothetical protein
VDADDFKATCSVHFDVYWELREWARKEVQQLFVLTEKASNTSFVTIGVLEKIEVLDVSVWSDRSEGF